MSLVREQLDALRAVDDHGGRGGQGVVHEVLQAHAVHDDHIGPFYDLHIADREGIIVETAHGLIDDGAYLHALHLPDNGPCEEVDGVSGGGNGQRIPLLGRRGFPAGHAAGGEGETKNKEQGKNRLFQENTSNTICWLLLLYPLERGL